MTTRPRGATTPASSTATASSWTSASASCRSTTSTATAAAGYGFNGTLSWAATWTTAYNVYSTVNAPPSPAGFYQAQTSGNLAEITDSVFFNNTHASGLHRGEHSSASSRGANNNVQEPARSPITRDHARAVELHDPDDLDAPRAVLDPRPANSALTSVGAAPNDGFFTPAGYRGAFAPNVPTWLSGWTAAAGLRPGRRTGRRARPARRRRTSSLFDINGALNANGNAVGTRRRPERPVLRDGDVGLVDDDDVRRPAEPDHHPARRARS